MTASHSCGTGDCAGRGAGQRGFWDVVYQRTAGLGVDPGDEMESFHPPYYPPRRFSHMEGFFKERIRGIRGKRVVCIGGGLDKVGLYLAKAGNTVLSVELSGEAVDASNRLAEEKGLGGLFHGVCKDWLKCSFDREFDVAVTHDSLHHMDVPRALDKIRGSLRGGGEYIGLEPVCLMGALKRAHSLLPFHPSPFIDGEIELGRTELDMLSASFQRVECRYFDLMARESVAYLLYACGFRAAITRLGAVDYALMESIPFLRCMGSYVVFTAWK